MSIKNLVIFLVVRVTHVAMYIGNSEFIHASGKVRISSMDSTKSN